MLTLYHNAMRFAGEAHGEQRFPGTERTSYMVHIALVTAEVWVAAQRTPQFNLELGIGCAILHDVVEDTEVSLEQVRVCFGDAIANGVAALTKNNALPKQLRMSDSLQRIRQQPYEVWAVKLADRICNMQQPPVYWSDEKKSSYRLEAVQILQALGEANGYLQQRLWEKIASYPI